MNNLLEEMNILGLIADYNAIFERCKNNEISNADACRLFGLVNQYLDPKLKPLVCEKKEDFDINAVYIVQHWRPTPLAGHFFYYTIMDGKNFIHPDKKTHGNFIRDCQGIVFDIYKLPEEFKAQAKMQELKLEK